MEHIKKFIMIALVIALAAGAAFIIRRHFSETSDGVKIQNFCLGLCGKDSNGNGMGIGIGASDRGPLIVAGPWGDKKQDNYEDDQEDND